MRRSLTIVAIVALCSTPLRADVTVKSTTSLEGGFAAMMGGMMPTVVTQIKGNKARTDVVMGAQTVTTIMDLDARQIIILNAVEKTAQIVTAETVPSAPEGLVMPKIDASLKPTGQAKVIGGAQCDEHMFTMTLSMAEMAASPKMSPQAAEMIKDMRVLMNGSMWLAKSGPGIEEFVAFQAASAKQSMAVVMRSIPGVAASGFERLLESFSGAAGLPYLTEMTMTVEAGGEAAAMMKQMGTMKMTSRVTEVSTDVLPDDLFKVPDDYQVNK